ANIRSRSAITVTSALTVTASLPSALPAAVRLAWSRPEATTVAPSLGKSCAVARPIPQLPPVMSTTLFANRFIRSSDLVAWKDEALTPHVTGCLDGRPVRCFGQMVRVLGEFFALHKNRHRTINDNDYRVLRQRIAALPGRMQYPPGTCRSPRRKLVRDN